MVIYHVREPTDFFFHVHTGGCFSEYLAPAAFVEEVDNLFDSFNGGTLRSGINIRFHCG
jgi:hypothetical protein